MPEERVTRAAVALSIGWLLACGGLVPRPSMQENIARAELLQTPEGDQLALGLQAVYLRCSVGTGDLTTERCQEVDALVEQALDDDDLLSEAEWKTLSAAAPELLTAPEPGSALDRLRTDIERKKRSRVNRFDRWDVEAELTRRFDRLGWEDIDCDTKQVRASVRIRCTADIGNDLISVRVFRFESFRDRDEDEDEVYLPGASKEWGKARMNVRAYDEAKTKLLAKAAGLLDADLTIEAEERWARRYVRRMAEELYDCEEEDGEISCTGGTEDYENTIELEVGRDVTLDAGIEWYGVTLDRVGADGVYYELEYVDTALSELRLEELLGAVELP